MQQRPCKIWGEAQPNLVTDVAAGHLVPRGVDCLFDAGYEGVALRQHHHRQEGGGFDELEGRGVHGDLPLMLE